MSKKWILGLFVIAGFLGALCSVEYFRYSSVIDPLFGQQQTINLDNSREINLNSGTGQDMVFGLILNVKGSVSDTVHLKLQDLNQQYREAILIPGKVDTTLSGDWYSASCQLLFEGADELSGNLKVDYKFRK